MPVFLTYFLYVTPRSHSKYAESGSRAHLLEIGQVDLSNGRSKDSIEMIDGGTSKPKGTQGNIRLQERR